VGAFLAKGVREFENGGVGVAVYQVVDHGRRYGLAIGISHEFLDFMMEFPCVFIAKDAECGCGVPFDFAAFFFYDFDYGSYEIFAGEGFELFKASGFG